jgi:Phage integrase, N-terminal SAM-like domain
MAPSERRRGTAPVALPAPYAAVLEDYTATLQSAPLSDQTRRTYASKVRQFLAWLAGADLDADPLASAAGRDWAVRDYRTHLQAVLKRSPATINNALAAVDDLYIRRGLGPPGSNGTETYAKQRPDQLWVADLERHEALFDRAVMKGQRGPLVAAGGCKLGAARSRRRG